MDIDAASLGPLERYKLLTALVVPRPIALVSTIAADGVLNLAPFSFFNVFGATPPVIVLGINTRSGQPKDTFANIVATGEFVVNVATAALAEQVNLSSGDHPASVDEFALVGLTPVPAAAVKAPRVAEAPAHLECTLMHVLPLDDGPNALIVARVVHIHTDDRLINGTRIDQSQLDAIGRMGGPVYCYSRDTFSMERPAI